MKNIGIFFVLLVLGALVQPRSFAVGQAGFPDPPKEARSMMTSPAVAVFAGGCFWGMEGVFERLDGVLDVVSGYCGGEEKTAIYELVCSGRTGHAEAVKVSYDPARVDYGTLLKVFFSVAHDPTELDAQGPDEGPQYRSAIFYSDEGQRRLAEAYIKKLDEAKVFPSPIVTRLEPFKAFYPAEDYHQNFMKLHPNYPYVLYNDWPKIRALEKLYPSLLATDKGEKK